MEKLLKNINLFIPGAAKSGTSSLHELLNLHPEINMSKNKEPHFFSLFSGKVLPNQLLKEYLDFFDFKNNYRYRGESSTGYFYFKEFKENFHRFGNNNSKFIFILRNPIDRTFSHYNYLKSLGSERDDLKTAILKNHKKDPSVKDLLPELIVKNYYQYSLYGKWLKKIYAHFDKKNIKIILFENLKKEPLETLNDCFQFLNIKQLQELPEITSNKTVKVRFPQFYRKVRIFAFNKSKLRDVVKHFFPVKFRRKYKKKITEILLSILKTNKPLTQITQENRTWLCQLYKEDIKLLKQVTGLKFEEWKDFNED